jgi:hypothetical protein
LLSLYSDGPDKAQQFSSDCSHDPPLILACHWFVLLQPGSAINCDPAFSTRVLAWCCRREIQFGRLGALLAPESEHCGPGEEFRKAFTKIDSCLTTLDKPLTAVFPSAKTDRMSA